MCQGSNFGLAMAGHLAGPSLCGSGGAFRGSGRHSEGSRACSAVGHSPSQGAFKDFGGAFVCTVTFRRSQNTRTLWGFKEFRESGNTFRGRERCSGCSREYNGRKGLKEF